MTLTETQIETIAELRHLPAMGESRVVERWLEQFRSIPGNEDAADFPLTPLQRRVANHPDAFGDTGPNLLITGPTSAGKTLAAEMLMASRLERGHDERRRAGCIYAVPLRALATEKFERFRRVFGDAGVYVSSSDYQEYDRLILRKGFRVAVVVYEKLYSWLTDNQRDGHRIISNSSLLIIDELQMLADTSRGAKLELILTLMRDVQKRRARSGSSPRGHDYRIVGLGPTAEALVDVADWIDATTIHSADDERPVPLVQGYVRLDGRRHLEPLPEPLREALPGGAVPLPDIRGSSRDELTTRYVAAVLTGEDQRRLPVGAGKRILVYAATKSAAEAVAHELALALGTRQPHDRELEARADGMEGTSSLAMLRKTMSAGVGFHHGDLTFDERRLVEQLFTSEDSGSTRLDVVVCTPTLAMGVNLPADHIIFPTTDTFRQSQWEFRGVQAQPLTPLEYRNFAGRAGRYRPNPPRDHHGVSLFLTHKSDEEAMADLVEGLIRRRVAPLEPALHLWPYGLAPLALAALAWQSARPDAEGTAPDRMRELLRSTFAGYKEVSLPVGDGDEPRRIEDAAVDELIALGLERGHEELVGRRPDVAFDLGQAGQVVATFGIDIRTYEILHELSQSVTTVLEQPFKVLERLGHAPELMRLYPTRVPEGREGAKLTAELSKFFRKQAADGHELGPNGELLVEIGYVPSNQILSSAMRTAAAWLWMEGRPAAEILSSPLLPGVRYGAVAMLTDQLAWLMSALAPIWTVTSFARPETAGLSDEQLAELEWNIRRFELSLRYGVPDGLEAAAHLRVPGLHRERLLALWQELGGWTHPVWLLNHPTREVSPPLRPVFRALKDVVARREWGDDPRDDGDRQLSLLREAVDLNASEEVDPGLPDVIRDFHRSHGEDLVLAVHEALRRRPLAIGSVELSEAPATGRSELTIAVGGGLYGGVAFAGAGEGTVAWGDILAVLPASGPDGRRPAQAICVVDGELAEDVKEQHRPYEPVLVVTKTAFGQLVARAADEPYTPSLPDGSGTSASDAVRHILLNATHAVLESARDADALIDGRRHEARVPGASVGRGALPRSGRRTKAGDLPADAEATRTVAPDAEIALQIERYQQDLDRLATWEDPLLEDHIRPAVELAESLPRQALAEARIALEYMVKNVCQRERRRVDLSAAEIIKDLAKHSILSPFEARHADFLRGSGNLVSHVHPSKADASDPVAGGQTVHVRADASVSDALAVIPSLFHLAQWYRRRMTPEAPAEG